MGSNKKDKEQQCLDNVLHMIKMLRGDSKRIIKKISGVEYPREDKERPDFVKYCPPVNKHEKETLIGIEHFRVDHFSLQKKDGKMASTGITIEKDIRDIYENNHNEVLNSDYISEKVAFELSNCFEKYLKEKEISSYTTFLNSFEYTLEKHLKSVNVYRENLQRISEGKYNVELALLIEIHAEFGTLFLNDRNGVHKEKDMVFPIFEDMISFMEDKIDVNKVKYVIFCMGKTLYTGDIKVIAVQTKNIRKNLERQNITIYKYAGEDLIYYDLKKTKRKNNIDMSYIIENDKVTFTSTYENEERNEQVILEEIFYSLRKALEFRERGFNFITTYGTQMMLEVLGDYIIGWERNCKANIPFPVFIPFTEEDLLNKLMKFEQKFSIRREEENYE